MIYLGNELKAIHKANKLRIIPWVMTWDGVVTKHHKEYVSQLKIPQPSKHIIVLKTTLESISMDYNV